MSTDPNNIIGNHKTMSDDVRMYYNHQYDRMAKLEEQGLTITNVVVTLSVVAFTFGFSNTQGLNIIAGVGLPVIIILANGFAIFYATKTGSWIRTHRLRAKRVLNDYAPELYQLDETTFALYRTGILGLGRRKIQILLHCLLIIASALIPFILYMK